MKIIKDVAMLHRAIRFVKKDMMNILHEHQTIVESLANALVTFALREKGMSNKGIEAGKAGELKENYEKLYNEAEKALEILCNIPTHPHWTSKKEIDDSIQEAYNILEDILGELYANEVRIDPS